MNPYNRVAELIHYLDQRRTEQPNLAQLASQVGMSPFHMHRLFSSWAAVTPKDFLQCLTMAHAKRLLQGGASVLDAALSSGLSGPSRLHDLSVALEAATPGELKAGGEGWTLQAGFTESPFGRALIAESPRGLCHISFVSPTVIPRGHWRGIHELWILRQHPRRMTASERGDNLEWARLQSRWPRARLERCDAVAQGWAKKIFQRPQKAQAIDTLRAYVKGTPFQVQVWRALMQIPPGTLTTYGRLAAAIKRPSAYRAVGTAVGQNWLGFLIPCHRVIRETGVIGDYRWGTTRKRAMLAWEQM